MTNYNGNIKDLSSDDFNNRGFLYGDSVFETIKIVDNKIIFWEEHYLRLMSSMRILRIEIPNNYTPEFFEKEIIKINLKTDSSFSGRVRLTIYRGGSGLYLPNNNFPIFVINSNKTNEKLFKIDRDVYKVDLFKDYQIQSNLISNLKTNNRVINVIGSIYAQENELDNCVLLNDNKLVTEFLNGNIFIVNDNVIKTPTISTGCLNGVMRKKIIELIKKVPAYKIQEKDFSPYELISSDEIWVTNSISGIIPVTEYRRKSFSNNIGTIIINYFNKQFTEF
ncbi:MAG: aminotransferase class IV [Flavobacteriaceae bacterium]|nr:aminotransferase class IV [Flavobacteriaceae bacterium]RCL67682.1 MAG: aminotransferase class IV [Cryomorphaceae bacterium]|tara:strand:+ start:415 stop:1251 length:837 start_codon:yes stop_codon:yes gene_type:complete